MKKFFIDAEFRARGRVFYLLGMPVRIPSADGIELLVASYELVELDFRPWLTTTEATNVKFISLWSCKGAIGPAVDFEIIDHPEEDKMCEILSNGEPLPGDKPGSPTWIPEDMAAILERNGVKFKIEAHEI